MSEERFGVATVSGYRTLERKGGHSKLGLSAHVIDTFHLCRVVRTFRSEEHFRLPGQRGGFRSYGIDGALRAAEEYAADLNREEEEVHAA